MSESPRIEPGELRSRFSARMRDTHRELLVFASAAVGSREAAKDIVQESFVAAWKSYERFDESRDFSTWMRGIVRNKTKDWFRSRQREPDLDLQFMEGQTADWQEAKERGSDVFDLVTHCIEKLPANYKTAVRSFYFDDQEGSDAALELGISQSNLRKRLQRARSLLHGCLSGQINPETTIHPEESHV